MNRVIRSILLAVLASSFPALLFAQVPERINYQGRLVDEGGLVNANKDVIMRLFSASSAGTEYYNESQSVAVVDGLYTFCLGASNAVPGSLASALMHDGVWLEATVDGSTLAPREQVKAVSYALKAGAVTNGAVSTSHLAPDAVTTDKILDGAVDTDDLADGATTANKIANGEIGASKLNTNDINALYVNRAGDSMTGTLQLPADGLAVDTDQLVAGNGGVGIGTVSPGEALHIRNGNMLIDAAGEQEIRMVNTSLPDNPAFRIGRVQAGGDGSPNFRVLYSDDQTVEGSVFEFDSKGIIASVKTNVGSHFEGFLKGDAQPVFRLNSFPQMQLEFGPGGVLPTDIAIRRSGGALEVVVGSARALRIEPTAGAPNLVAGDESNAAGGALGATVGGGELNLATGNWSTVAGGFTNAARGTYSAVSGGERNIADGGSSVVVGGRFSTAIGDVAIAGGEGCHATAYGVALGLDNTVDAYASGIFSGDDNVITGTEYAVIVGGQLNRMSSSTEYGAILGGEKNALESGARHSLIAGGSMQTIGVSAASAAIVGGEGNGIGSSASHAFIAGGFQNFAGGIGSIVAGGQNNNAANTLTFAAGNRAKADFAGSFVWADASDFDFPSVAANDFSVRAVGGVRFVSGIGPAGAVTSGVQLAAGSGTWTSLSDVHAKENFVPIHPDEILQKVASLPVSTWNYRTQDDSVRHMGPMAQDFRAAFGLGESDTGITTVDADGVALAAIQALYAENRALKKRLAAMELDGENDERGAMNDELRSRLAQMEMRLAALEGNREGL